MISFIQPKTLNRKFIIAKYFWITNAKELLNPAIFFLNFVSLSTKGKCGHYLISYPFKKKWFPSRKAKQFEQTWQISVTVNAEADFSYFFFSLFGAVVVLMCIRREKQGDIEGSFKLPDKSCCYCLLFGDKRSVCHFWVIVRGLQ